MFDEDNPDELIKNPSERILLIQLAVMGVFAGWAVGGNCSWAPGFIAAIGFFAPVLFFIHNSVIVTGAAHPKLKYLTATSPAWLLLIVMGLACLQPLLATAVFDGTEFFSLENGNPWTPGSVFYDHWVKALMLCGVYLGALNLLIVPETRLSLRRLLRTLCVSALLLVCLGGVGWILELKEIAFFITAPTSNFFSVFPSAHHWCSFALLWIGAFGTLCVENTQDRSWRFFFAENTFPLCGILLLGISVACLGTPVQVLILGFLAGCVLLLCGAKIAKGKPSPGGLALALWVVGIACLIAGIIVGMWLAGVRHDAFADARGTSGAADWATRAHLWATAWQAFWLRPLWGWGADSFGVVVSFFQDAKLGPSFFAYASSDLLQSLMEKGLLLTLMWLAFPAYFLAKYFKRVRQCLASIPLLAACGAIALYAIVDMPFQSPAVLVSWWIVFFVGIQWARLEARTVRPRKAPKPLLKRNAPAPRKD